MNLALINTKTNEVKVFSGTKKVVGSAQFTRMLYPEEVEGFRANPEKFLNEVGWTDKDESVSGDEVA